MENIKEKMGYALDLLNSNDFIEAQKVLKEIISQDENNIEALKTLGLCEVNLDNPIEAIKCFEMASSINQDDATSLFYLANCLSRIGEKEKAIEKFNKVIALRPDYLDAYKSVAMINIEFSQVENAIEIIKKALQNPSIEPDHTLYYIIATAFMLKKDHKSAIEYLESAYKLAQDHLPIINSLATCYMKTKRLDEALEVLNKAFKIDNNNSLTSFNLGVLHQTRKEYKEALKYFQISYQLDPSTTMMSSLANCAMKAGEFDVACVVYKNLLMAYPNNTEYRHSYIEALENTRQYMEALNNVNQLLELDSKDVPLLKKKGSLLRKLGFCAEAIEIFQHLICRGKIDVELYYNLAFSYVQLADYDNAKEMFKKCIILEPNNPYAHKDLGVLYLKMNCYEWAVEEVLKAIELDNEVAEFYYSLGVSYVMLSQVSQGKEALVKADELEPNNADTLAFLGYVYMLERDFSNALLALEKALEIDPSNFIAKSHSAKYFFEIKKYDVAAQFLTDIIEHSQDDESMNMLAICYLNMNDYEKAMAIFYKLALIYPKNHILLTNLAKCEYKCDKKQEALEHLRQALMIFDDYDDALSLLEEINNGK